MNTVYTFSDLAKAHAWYLACSRSGLAATLETVIPCAQWRVVVFA